MATNRSATCLGTSRDDHALNEDRESQVKPKPLLLKLLRFAGAQSETFTVKEVMHFLGQYIITKQLYDEKQQHIVHCSDDLLSHLFGVQSFSIKEPRTLYAMLSKNLTSVNHEGRRSNCSDSDNDVSSDEQFYSRRRKRHRSDSISLHWDDLSLCLISKLRRERGNSESSGSPSHLDIHVATEGEDSSDKFSVEFEVESVHSEDYSEFSEDSQDRSDKEIYEVAIFEAADSDEGTFIEEIDPEISEADYWKCSKCEELNPPLPRHCHRCWSIRQDWLPDKPKLQQSDKEQDDGIDVPDCKKPPLESKESNCSDLFSETSHCSESQETECSQPSTSGSFNCCSQESEKENADKGEKGESNTFGPLEACVICQARPKNGCIVHGRTGHLLACYSCAKKLKKRNKPCPLCREPIQLVVLTYFS
ncbi:E3 ubiquitin-protein ligase Mdm2 isoform X4 [Scyliorhinus canicula]|uniref:E3 ubiquitin-protein ligase Mdm2 isoform X4 n=1 Tax=Scyliorhinus canicula TaxID=7830 RepID=UPI0018F3FBD9|nr:E3 ubiquitin-protein ligase Mdm2 isoform X4 [Scyliorhinus canicula]